MKDKLKAAHPVEVYEVRWVIFSSNMPLKKIMSITPNVWIMQLLEPTLDDAMRRTQVCVTKMTGTLKMALRQMRG